MAKREDKLRSRVADLIGPDEEFVAAATAQTGPKDMTMALVSLILSPIAAVLMLAFARKSYVVLKTTSGTRLYSSSNISPSRATDLKSQNFPDRVVSSEISHGGETYRMSSWASAVPTNAAVVPVRGHDSALAANRNRAVLSWAAIPISIAALIAVVAVSWPYISPPNSFTVAAQADEEYCDGDNYSQYMAVDTTNGPVLIIGGDKHLANDIPGLHRRSNANDQFDGLVTSRGRLTADKVVCVRGSGECRTVQVHSVEGTEAVQTPDEKWDCAPDREQTVAQFDKFLCEAVGCRIEA